VPAGGGRDGTVEPMSTHNVPTTADELLEQYVWARQLPTFDLGDVLADLADAADDPTELKDTIRSWEETAAIFADQELLARLTRPVDFIDGRDVPRP
jgi:hypothetical protein